MSKDSYQVFLDVFNIKKEDLYHWGIESTIFPAVDVVADEWEKLKQRIFTNQTVYIRGYGRDAHGTQLYQELYKNIFGNENIKKDPTNNTVPHRHIQQLTGLRRNEDVYNYQVSHIWGRTKNVFMFESPWNICYTPKLIDPFTGHETKGDWPMEFQRLFIAHAYSKYKTFIDDYNQLLIDHDVINKINMHLRSIKSLVPERELAQFERDVHSEFAPIIL